MSFRDTFTRGSSRQQNLQYDDNAAYHFYLTVLLLITLPLLYSILKSIFRPFSNLPQLKEIQSLLIFKERLVKFKKQNRFRYLTFGFIFKMLIACVLLLLIFRCVKVLHESTNQIKGFDPYEILEVSQSASIEQIKKSYRKLALKYHPDRNQGDPQANAKFIMISKAYECLTNDQAKQNCKKFGNPEGSTTSFNVGIALPSFLVKKENHVAIMGIVFVLVVIVLPIALIYYHSQINKYDDEGMLLENHGLLRQKLNENFTEDDILKLLACCLEFRGLSTNLKKQQAYQKLEIVSNSQVNNIIKKGKFLKSINKALILIGARIYENQIPVEIEDDFKIFMKKSPILLRAMVSFCLPRSTLQFKTYYRNQKFIGIRTIKRIIKFSQNLIQGKSFNSNSFEQLSFTNQQFQHITKKRKRKPFPSLLALKKNNEEKQQILNLLSLERKSLIAEEIEYFPMVEVQAQIHTGGQKDITQEDVIECLIKIKSHRKSNFCSAPSYPFLKLQGWYVIVNPTDEITILSSQYFSFEKDYHEIKLKMAPFKKGLHSLDINVLSDCYFGIDIEQSIKFEVFKKKMVQEDQEKISLKETEVEEEGIFSRLMGSILPKEEQELSDKQE